MKIFNIQFAAQHLTCKDKDNLSKILDKQQIRVDSNETEKSYQLDQMLHKYLAKVVTPTGARI